jgi:hypothetical protein
MLNADWELASPPQGSPSEAVPQNAALLRAKVSLPTRVPCRLLGGVAEVTVVVVVGTTVVEAVGTVVDVVGTVVELVVTGAGVPALRLSAWKPETRTVPA